MILRKTPGRRNGATAVEMAMVLAPAIMMIFGVFEYSWLLLNWNALKNAAREGCRYAVVNSYTDPNIATDVQTIVTNYMAGESTHFSNFSVTVSGTHQGVSYTGSGVSNLVAGDMITVTVTGQFHYLNIFPFNSTPTVTITSGVTMVCEGVM
jgi:Flp pilus assembly protein TadG